MSDLYDQCRILSHLYILSLTGAKTGLWLLVKDKELKFMYKAGTLGPALNRLKRTGYVKDDDKALLGLGLELTGEGLIAIETLFRKFLKYMKKRNPDELGTWINTLELNKNNSWELIRDSFHFIRNEPPVKKAFDAFLNDLGSLENLRSSEVEVEQPQPDLGELIDDLFQHIGDINKLFEHKLGQKLFCISPEAYSIMSRATRGRKVDYTNFVASVALVLDGICHRDLRSLLEPGKKFPGSISKIENILNHNNVRHNPDTISKLRFIRQIRNTTLPMHDTGSQVVDDLKKIGLTFPIKDPRKAVLTILKSLISCLKEMKTWFAVK